MRTEVYTSRTRGRTEQRLHLADDHRRMLEVESNIDPAVAAERGYWTATRREQLDAVKQYQRRVPALVIPTYSPDGATMALQVRPDSPRVRDGKAIKYETPGGSRCILDVHPRNLGAVADAGTDLWITEGIKKADALTSRGLCAIGLVGVWNWQRDGELLPCWDHVALEGRRVLVAYDSDVVAKEGVQKALGRLTGALEARGADVLVVYLPDAPDGSKRGVDDYLAAGGTVEELEELARPFDPHDAVEERLGRDERLRRAIADLWSAWRAMPAVATAQCTDRSIMRVLTEEAARHGQVRRDGVQVVLDRRTISQRAASSPGPVHKAIGRLEAAGRLRRDYTGRKRDHAGALVLLTSAAAARAQSNHSGELRHRGTVRDLSGENRPVSPATPRSDCAARAPVQGTPHTPDSHSDVWYDCGDCPARAPFEELPELRWSGVLIAHDKDKAGRLQEVREHLARLGKKRGAIIAHLVDAGGSATMADLLERFAGKRTRPRDFHRRTLAMMEDPAIVVVEGATVRLAAGWREALDQARELGREQEAADRQRVNHELQRAAFRRPDRDRVSDHPANAGGDGWVEELERLPDPPAPELLYRLMGEQVPVGTPYGAGRLWQVFSDRVGVVLDAEPDLVRFLHPCELVLERVATT